MIRRTITYITSRRPKNHWNTLSIVSTFYKWVKADFVNFWNQFPNTLYAKTIESFSKLHPWKKLHPHTILKMNSSRLTTTSLLIWMSWMQKAMQSLWQLLWMHRTYEVSLDDMREKLGKMLVFKFTYALTREISTSPTKAIPMAANKFSRLFLIDKDRSLPMHYPRKNSFSLESLIIENYLICLVLTSLSMLRSAWRPFTSKSAVK